MDERVEFSVNGQQRAFRVRGDETAVEIIRDRLGLVVIQWLTRKIGARSGPRFARQLASSCAGSVSCSG